MSDLRKKQQMANVLEIIENDGRDVMINSDIFKEDMCHKTIDLSHNDNQNVTNRYPKKRY